jgi:hypothetical protein
LNGALNSLSIPQSIAFSSPAPGAYLSIPGILLAYDPELYGVPIVKKRPPIFRNDEGESTYLPGVPDAISITFKSDKGEVEQQAELIVQPLRGATGQYYASIPDEQKQKVAAIEVLFSSGANGQPAEGNGGEDRKLFTFQNGIGQRVVEKGDPSDGLASQLLYKFEGITSDDRYFVEFKFPLNTAELLDSQVVAEDPADEAGYFMQLAQLDQMIQSLVIAANASTDSSLPVNPADCTRDAQFVEDISLPDHTFIEHGQAATKIWRIRNTGTCVWTPAFQIQFAGGNPISWSKPSVIDVVHPGEMTDIRVEIISPDTPGIYHAWWQLADELGRSFGPYYHVIFESPQPATNIPGYGVIEGELKYPAGGVPAMTIYFLSTDGSQRFALDTEDGWNRYANELPIGEYYVFAKVAGDESGSGGGFTELVLCDMTCDDHALIPVTIEEGVATREINIFDWYAPAGSFPLP